MYPLTVGTPAYACSRGFATGANGGSAVIPERTVPYKHGENDFPQSRHTYLTLVVRLALAANLRATHFDMIDAIGECHSNSHTWRALFAGCVRRGPDQWVEEAKEAKAAHFAAIDSAWPGEWAMRHRQLDDWGGFLQENRP